MKRLTVNDQLTIVVNRRSPWQMWTNLFIDLIKVCLFSLGINEILWTSWRLIIDFHQAFFLVFEALVAVNNNLIFVANIHTRVPSLPNRIESPTHTTFNMHPANESANNRRQSALITNKRQNKQSYEIVVQMNHFAFCLVFTVEVRNNAVNDNSQQYVIPHIPNFEVVNQ